jgi:hypothetical protein
VGGWLHEFADWPAIGIAEHIFEIDNSSQSSVRVYYCDGLAMELCAATKET